MRKLLLLLIYDKDIVCARLNCDGCIDMDGVCLKRISLKTFIYDDCNLLQLRSFEQEDAIIAYCNIKIEIEKSKLSNHQIVDGKIYQVNLLSMVVNNKEMVLMKMFDKLCNNQDVENILNTIY